MKENSDKEECPRCGEAITEFDRVNTFFKCGSIIALDMKPNLQCSTKCYETQLAQQAARIQALEAEVLRLQGAIDYLEGDKVKWLEQENERLRGGEL